jgi:phage tail sheath protein FI
MVETRGTTLAVWEPKRSEVWRRVGRSLRSFLGDLCRKGALFEATADKGFFVHCDPSTDPTESSDLGRIVGEVGIGPFKPEEFVVFRVPQPQRTSG